MIYFVDVKAQKKVNDSCRKWNSSNIAVCYNIKKADNNNKEKANYNKTNMMHVVKAGMAKAQGRAKKYYQIPMLNRERVEIF